MGHHDEFWPGLELANFIGASHLVFVRGKYFRVSPCLPRLCGRSRIITLYVVAYYTGLVFILYIAVSGYRLRVYWIPLELFDICCYVLIGIQIVLAWFAEHPQSYFDTSDR